ncbi:endonuclease/exonuclease/phosphatase family protein [Paenibacillus sp. JX-17]|uniref:Endonuclease/exonuclease/phosphatase family protein n=1 Tax=Paenibacillus lacisoli TaxID=3064525 RepID=A0ABT9CKN6_9BACL|nr:endonuclease/exonuclease/phosphatase family protein [Paenibacillus sp. JX-17]MDO7908188.1 endonuclease/exonuclease/phosphatase family protein [Paenibacillus sp. JX-17]
MKLLTLNTHSWMETEQLDKIRQLADFINEQKYDVIALQEVNQQQNSRAVEISALAGYHASDPETVIREDNFAYLLREQLDQPYSWTWVTTHKTFSVYDEGLALLSRKPITGTMHDYVSQLKDHNNYRTRKIAGIETEVLGQAVWFFSAHYGWWNDEESFRGQWDRTEDLLQSYRSRQMYIMGDFNNVAEVRDEGYDYVVSRGWHDLYHAAAQRDDGATVTKAIAGWKNNEAKLRIDYIFSSQPVKALRSQVVLNGTNGPVVSDHYGVAVEL